MINHDVEAFAQRSLVVTRGHTLVQVIGHHNAAVRNGQMLTRSLAHDANAPVEVGREAVFAVVM